MSLIDEALKRARQEASRQDAAEREKRYARVPVYVPPSRRSRPWLLPVVVTVCLAAGVAGGVLLTRSPHPPAPSAAPPQAPTPAAVATVAEKAAPQKPAAEKPAEKTVKKIVDETPVIEEKAPAQPAPTPEKIAIEPRPVPTPAMTPPPSPVIALPQPSHAPAPAPREEPAPAPMPAPPTPATPSADIRSYVREVPVADGGTLRLNGIAFSAQPVALFGDKVVAPGESISGFTVVAIEAQRVKLQGPGGMVYVTLK